ncbi:hypothetical protein VPNG_07360 [Cytospora leucostoma]|uniref:Uncharacterized protein n=1 Tax=Cytospora leucostoma TaxID=1230097 RepID=A0A423WUX2_9PEZI|nr:hypothetical protein VPNG_07360 [Cytospora leucostoma]
MPALIHHVGEAIRVMRKEDSIEGIIGNDVAIGQDGAIVYTHVDLHVDSDRAATFLPESRLVSKEWIDCGNRGGYVV